MGVMRTLVWGIARTETMTRFLPVKNDDVKLLVVTQLQHVNVYERKSLVNCGKVHLHDCGIVSTESLGWFVLNRAGVYGKDGQLERIYSPLNRRDLRGKNAGGSLNEGFAWAAVGRKRKKIIENQWKHCILTNEFLAVSIGDYVKRGLIDWILVLAILYHAFLLQSTTFYKGTNLWGTSVPLVVVA